MLLFAHFCITPLPNPLDFLSLCSKPARVVKGKPTDYGARSMTIVLNGEEHEYREGMTIADVVTDLGLGKRRIAVEINREIVPRDSYATRRLQAGDHIEIVHFVGGG